MRCFECGDENHKSKARPTVDAMADAGEGRSGRMMLPEAAPPELSLQTDLMQMLLERGLLLVLVLTALCLLMPPPPLSWRLLLSTCP